MEHWEYAILTMSYFPFYFTKERAWEYTYSWVFTKAFLAHPRWTSFSEVYLALLDHIKDLTGIHPRWPCIPDHACWASDTMNAELKTWHSIYQRRESLVRCMCLKVWKHTKVIKQHVFIYSRPIASIRAKMEHEKTYWQTSNKYFTCIFLRKTLWYRILGPSLSTGFYSFLYTVLMNVSCPTLYPSRCRYKHYST